MYINSMGSYVPTQRIDNDYFKNVNGLDADWIFQRTGICTRSKAAPEENVNTMAFAAVEDALSSLPYDIRDVDLIVHAAYCVYDSVATAAHEVQRRYDIKGAKAFYLSAACSSFVNGLEAIEGYFSMGKASKALLICPEHNTYYADESDPKSGHLWGDGAVAFFISKEKVADSDRKILGIFTEGLGQIGAGPEGVKLMPAEGGISMPNGRDVFMNACKYMEYALDKVLTDASLSVDDLSHVICHQANMRIISYVAKELGKEEGVFLNNIEELGNTGSASAALVLCQRIKEIARGKKVALVVFGGGYSCGSVLVEI